MKLIWVSAAIVLARPLSNVGAVARLIVGSCGIA
jgi:hypothetical protein